MSLAGVLAYFMENDMECDYFFWLLLAEWFGLGVALPGLSSHPVVQKLSPVWTEHGVVYTCQSTDASGRISLSMWLARAVRTWVWAIRSRPSYLAVIVAVSGCCLWRTIGFLWRCYGRNSWFASGYMFCIKFESFLTNFTPFLCYGGLVSCSVVSVLTQNREVCSADAPVQSLSRCSHMEILTLFP